VKSPAWLTAALTVAVAASTAAATADRGPQPEEWLIERFEQSWQIDEGAAISISNPWGDLAVRTHQASEVYLLGHLQRHRDDPRPLDLQVEEIAASPGSPATLALTVELAGSTTEPPPADWAKRRIDVTVFVPRAANLRFETGDGQLEVRGTAGHVQATTRSGTIKLRVGGSVDVHSQHGRVLAQFTRTDWRQPIEIETKTSEIRVEMPAGGRATVAIETRGEITSDFSTTIEHHRGSLLKTARLTVGNGGVAVRLSSQQGPIKILGSLVPSEEDGG